MIGIMNSPTKDSVDFYASNESRRVRKQESLEQTQAFTEVKRKPTISYSQAGLRLIDGKPEKIIDGVQLWHTVIKKKALSSKTDTDKEVDVEECDVDEMREKVIEYVTNIIIEEEGIRVKDGKSEDEDDD